MANVKEVTLRYTPRPYQVPLLQAMQSRKYNRAIAVWHRRAGKDLSCLNYTSIQAMEIPGNYYLYYPSFAQGRKILWDGKDKQGVPFLDYIPKEVIRGRPLDTEMKINFVNKSILQVMGTDDPDRLVGPNPRGVVFSEYSLMNPEAWELIRPILLENEGWAIFIYTPRGKNHGYTLYRKNKNNKEWFVELRTIKNTWDENGNPIITDEMVQKEIEQGMDPELAQQEFYCSWEGPKQGAYYISQMLAARKENRIARVPHETRLDVHTAWDFGVGDYTCIWFFQLLGDGREIRLIDYHQDSGHGLPHYAKIVREKPYVYGKHLAPWDVAVTEFASGVSRVETAEDLGITFDAVEKLPIEDGREAVRSMFPKVWIDEDKCEEGLEALDGYSRVWDEKTKSFKNEAKHNKFCHGADAFRTLAVGISEYNMGDTRTGKQQLYADSGELEDGFGRHGELQEIADGNYR